jgi:hypothetical protein
MSDADAESSSLQQSMFPYQKMAAKSLISILASPKQHSQPLDAFLCFDVSSRRVSNPSDTPNLPAQVEATCVADKQIDWPNEIIVRLILSQKATEPWKAD